MRDAWALRGHRAASNRLQVPKNALSPIIDDETDTRITGDPFHKVKKVSRPHNTDEAHPIWEDAEVEAAINAAIANDQAGLARAMTIAYNQRNEVWKERQLSQAVDRLMTRLAKNGKVRAAVDEQGHVYCPLTIHGLRHSRGVELAHAGASDAEIMGQLEQPSAAAAQEYRRQANRRRMADSAQDKIDNVVRLRAVAKVKRTAQNRQ